MDTCKDTVWSKKYKVNLDSFDRKWKDITWAEYTIYTDGSKIDKGVGPKNKILPTLTAKLPDEATVLQAELKGIKTGYEFFFDNLVHKLKFIKIISDSQTALLPSTITLSPPSPPLL